MTQQEKPLVSIQPNPATCDGSILGYDSECCDADQYAICPNPPCSCTGDCQMGFGPENGNSPIKYKTSVHNDPLEPENSKVM